MRYQAFVLDLDGTLLGDNDQINEVNLNAVRSVIQNGYTVTLASGRPHALMQPYTELLGITESIICCNGAYLYDPLEDQVVMSRAFGPEQLLKLLSLLNQHQLDFTLYSSEGVFAQKSSKHLSELRQKAKSLNSDVPIEIIAEISELVGKVGDVYKLLVSSDDKSQLCELRDTLHSTLQVDLSSPNKLDITPKDVSKGNALNHWLEQRQIPAKSVVAFGDGDNDLSMFDVVGEPVAMENASPSLKNRANLIVTDNNGCGIGQYLRMIELES